MTADLREYLQRAIGSAYRLDRELGGGGMSRVFAAEETSLARYVVIKVLPPELAAEVNAGRFRREVQLAARLQHPLIVPLLSAGEAGGLLYYTMPLVDGDSLRARLTRSGEFPVSEAVRVLRDIADALAYAHGCGVVHRDIKPANILLSGQHALVVDFGVAKALTAATTDAGSATSTNVVVGTALYMAPEQAAADPAVDHRADIYAFGCVAYELLVGESPFAGRAPQSLLAAHLTERPPRVDERRREIPRRLADLVMRCLEKDPADRPQSAEEVLALLAAAETVGSAESASERPGRDAPLRDWRAGRRASLGAAVGLVAIAVVGAALAMRYSASPPPKSHRVVVAIFENRTGDTTLDALGPMAADWITRGLLRTGLVQVVDARTELGDAPTIAGRVSDSGGAGVRRRGSGMSVRELGAATGAGTVVWGTYYRSGDSLRFETQVTDAARGLEQTALEPVSTPVADPLRGIEAVRQRVMGSFATRLDSRFRAFSAAPLEAPTFEAYQAFLDGTEAFWSRENRRHEALTHFHRAAALDTTFDLAALWAGVLYAQFDQCATTDSIIRVIDVRRQRLTQFDRLFLDRTAARCRGDQTEVYRTMKQSAALVPGSDYYAFQVGAMALRDVNRPREAATVLAAIDTTRGWARTHRDVYIEMLSAAYHALGDHEREWALVRRLRRDGEEDLWSLLQHVKALAALGRLDDVRQRLERAEALPSSADVTATDVMSAAGEELRAHGYPAPAQAAFERAVARLKTRPDEGAPSEQRIRLARVLYLAGRLEEATALYARFDAASRSGSRDRLDARGALGAIAARRGKRADARRIDAWLADLPQPYLRGRQTIWRARIAALLGERERAVSLLRDAFAQGWEYNAVPVHVDVDLESLRNYAPYQELMRPRG